MKLLIATGDALAAKAEAYQQEGDSEACLKYMQSASEVYTRSAKDQRIKDAVLQKKRIQLLLKTATLCYSAGQIEEACAVLDEALGVLNEPHDSCQRPDDLSFDYLRASILTKQAIFAAGKPNSNEVQRRFADALSALDGLIDKNIDTHTARMTKAEGQVVLAQFCLNKGLVSEALLQIKSAYKELRIAKSEHCTGELHEKLGAALALMAEVYFVRGQHRKAVGACWLGLKYSANCPACGSSDALQFLKIAFHTQLGQFYIRHGTRDEADGEFQSAAYLAEEIVRTRPRFVLGLLAHGHVWYHRGKLLSVSGAEDAAEIALDKALDSTQKALDILPQHRGALEQLANILFSKALVLHQKDKLEDSLEHCNGSIALYERYNLGQENIFAGRSLGAAYVIRAELLRKTSELAQARNALRTAADTMHEWMNQAPGCAYMVPLRDVVSIQQQTLMMR